MKSVSIEGKTVKIEYRTSSDMRTKASFRGKTYKQGLSANVYNVEGGDYVVIVLDSVNGEILNSATLIETNEYISISFLYHPSAAGRYHTALLERCGAENHLKLN